MKVKVQWIEGRTFLGESGSGHGVLMDTAPDIGGRNLGPRPMEMLLLGMGGCTGIDVVMMLQKMREKVSGCSMELEAERAGEEPKVFTNIKVTYVVTGKGVKPANVERAIQLSAEKYCSASIMLGKTAAITHDFRIVEEE
ncbi:MAG TPA: OsmC family protein [Aestuariivirga sp.]|nr:OsmC family protein [Aestuariivirga sp.]